MPRIHKDPQILRILVIADSKLAVPPHRYGGAERIISYLCKGLAQRGHKVTLMAAAGSENYGRLVTYRWSGSKNLVERCSIKLGYFALSIRELFKRHHAIIACCRTDYLTPFLYAGVPLLYRFDNPINHKDVQHLTGQSRGPLTLVSVSNNQRNGIAISHLQTIYNSVDLETLNYSEVGRGGYLAFLGRLTSNKGVDTAIRVARRTGLPLKIAGNISDEPGGHEFFKREVLPHLQGSIEWIGEIDDCAKSKFLGNAMAILVPIRWEEQFVIVVPEALACGTPVIAIARGAMPELIQQGVNGFLVSNEDEMVEAVRQIPAIDRHTCRRSAEQRFACEDMLERHLAIVRALIAEKRSSSVNKSYR
jgi:glycosyltransferase involved in cell wall biosynthesis